MTNIFHLMAALSPDKGEGGSSVQIIFANLSTPFLFFLKRGSLSLGLLPHLPLPLQSQLVLGRAPRVTSKCPPGTAS